MAIGSPTIFEDILDEAGCPAEGRAFLKDRGVTTAAILSFMCKSEQDVETKLVVPFINGVNLAGNQHKLVGEADVWEAVIKFAWGRCAQSINSLLTPVQPPASATGQAGGTAGGSTQAAPSNKVPTTLPLGVWAQQIQK